MRILHAYKYYLPDMSGGIATAIEHLVAEFSPEHHSRVLSCSAAVKTSNYRFGEAEVRAVPSFGSWQSLPIAPTFPLELRRMMRSADLVALHHPFPLNDLGLCVAGKKTPPIVVHWHAEITARRFSSLVKPFIRRTLRSASQVIVSDESIINNSEDLIEHRAKCAVLPYGIDYKFWSKVEPEEEIEVGRIRGQYPKLIIAFGRLVPYKGFDVLINAMREIDASLVIIGEGDFRGHLENLARSVLPPERIRFTGHLSRRQVRQYLHAAKLFTFPSVSNAEAFGISQLEAMAAGLPVINTSLPTGVPHIARQGKEAITVKPRDVEALAAAIRLLLANEDLADRLGAAAQTRVRDVYSHQNYSSRVRHLYEKAYNRRFL